MQGWTEGQVDPKTEQRQKINRQIDKLTERRIDFNASPTLGLQVSVLDNSPQGRPRVLNSVTLSQSDAYPHDAVCVCSDFSVFISENGAWFFG